MTAARRAASGQLRLAAVLDDLEDGPAGWVVFLLGAALIALPSADWRIPDAQGVPYLGVLGIVAAAALLSLVVWVRIRARRSPRPLEALAVLVGVGIVIGTVTVLASQPLRDLGVYLHAGDAWRRGAPVYLDHLLTAAPADKTEYPFLYPPPVLVAFGIVGVLPGPLVVAGFVVGSLIAVVAALRLFGLEWKWVLAAMLWRPVLEGLWVVNVAVPLLALLAIAPRLPMVLVIPPAFKPYSGTATLWLLRERRWRALAIGLAVVLVLTVASLPFAGIDRWREWLTGLEMYARSQPLLPNYLYGIALVRWLPPLVALAIGLVVLVLALAPPGLEGLARLGLATPFLSPSVFVHGLLVAIPALLALRPVALWLALASMSFGQSLAWWIGPGLAVASWLVPALRRPEPIYGTTTWTPATGRVAPGAADESLYPVDEPAYQADAAYPEDQSQ